MTKLKMDEETGEVITCFNSETGEEESIVMTAPPRGRVFKIPTSYTNPKKEITRIKTDFSPTATTAVLFLLPTTIFFYPILAMIVVMVEVVIHVWAHRKNKLLKNRNLYFQSPLHIICKEFCGACKEENTTMKISKFQEMRADKIKKYGFEYVRRIVT